MKAREFLDMLRTAGINADRLFADDPGMLSTIRTYANPRRDLDVPATHASTVRALIEQHASTASHLATLIENETAP